MQFKCPHCGAEDVRKVSLMYEQATSNLNYREVGMRSDGVGSYAAGSGGIQNLMGGRIAPPPAPVKPKLKVGLIFGVIFGAFFFGITKEFIKAFPMSLGPFSAYVIVDLMLFLLFWGSTFGPVLGHIARMRSYQESLPDYRRRYESWTKKWMCMRCGEIYSGGLSA